MVMNRQA